MLFKKPLNVDCLHPLFIILHFCSCYNKQLPINPLQSEGKPFVFKYKYITYSGNRTFEQHYGIGYATASSPLSTWTKAEENPIAGKDSTLNITGIEHNSLLPTNMRT